MNDEIESVDTIICCHCGAPVKRYFYKISVKWECEYCKRGMEIIMPFLEHWDDPVPAGTVSRSMMFQE